MMIRQSVFLLMLSIFWVACADYNSSTSDDLEYVEVTANDANDTNFARAFGIIKTRCAGCHNPEDRHIVWNSYDSNQKWIDSGLVVKGNALTSDLIKKTWRNGPPGNMPPPQDLTEDDYNFLKKWINEMP